MTSTPNGGVRRIAGGISRRLTGRGVLTALESNQGELRDRLAAIEIELAGLAEQVRALRQIAEVQVQVANESTEVLGRLLRSATDRIEQLEEQVSAGS